MRLRHGLFDGRRIGRAMGVNGQCMHVGSRFDETPQYHDWIFLMEITTLALLVLIPLLVWRIYSRLKRMMGRQRSQLWRHWAAAILLPLLIAGLAIGARSDLLALSCLGAGAIAGAWLGILGIKLTRFENTDQGFFYTPNLHLGITVSMLFIARLLYRGLELYLISRAAIPVPAHDFTKSPLTLLLFGLLAAYYAAYGWGLVRWRRKPRAALN